MGEVEESYREWVSAQEAILAGLIVNNRRNREFTEWRLAEALKFRELAGRVFVLRDSMRCGRHQAELELKLGRVMCWLNDFDDLGLVDGVDAGWRQEVLRAEVEGLYRAVAETEH